MFLNLFNIIWYNIKNFWNLAIENLKLYSIKFIRIFQIFEEILDCNCNQSLMTKRCDIILEFIITFLNYKPFLTVCQLFLFIYLSVSYSYLPAGLYKNNCTYLENIVVFLSGITYRSRYNQCITLCYSINLFQNVLLFPIWRNTF